jgi:MoaA/NifB/PqqE/SkfB family radical SAM enzyme
VNKVFEFIRKAKDAVMLNGNILTNDIQKEKQEINIKKSFSYYSTQFPNDFPVIAPLPDDLQIGLSNICNFKCLFCAEHRPGHRPEVCRFSDSMYKLLKNVLPHIKQAAFHENSEFFLDPHFEEILQLCSQHRVTVSLNTNASYLSENQKQILNEYKGHINIAISLDAAKRDTYWKLRGYDFEKVIKNSKTLIRIISEKKSLRKKDFVRYPYHCRFYHNERK